MAITFHKESQADMTYSEISEWFGATMPQAFKPNQATYVLWKDGMFMGEGDFYHKAGDVYQYSHTVDYEDPQEMQDNRVEEVSTEHVPPAEDDPTTE